MVELLRQIERRAGKPIRELFDVICGTSTGALLAVALGMLQLSLDACNDIYTMLGRKVRAHAWTAALLFAQRQPCQQPASHCVMTPRKSTTHGAGFQSEHCTVGGRQLEGGAHQAVRHRQPQRALRCLR